MIQAEINSLIEGKTLSTEESYHAFSEIMHGKVSEMLIASFLTALRIKGETISEIAGAVRAMREVSTKIYTKHENVIDTCGTGGDGIGTFNISTVAAIIAASAGAVVAKHGNSAISSKCGSADILKGLGVNIEISSEKIGKCLDEIGLAFLYAPLLHNAMKYAMPVRRELGFRTIFNILGPLTNPASAKRQVIGVYKFHLTDTLAQVLHSLGTERALIVHAMDGMDEISTLGDTKVTEIKNGNISSYTLNYSDFGISQSSIESIIGGDTEKNIQILRYILDGKQGAERDIAILNSAAAIYISGITDSILEGITIAKDAVDGGKAKKKLDQLIEISNS